MAITGWNGENSGTPTHTRDVGSSDNGSESADVVNNITDNGTYYTFNGTDSRLRWNGNMIGEDDLEYKVRFRIHNNSKNDVQVIWKSGGNTNGAALGIDASNNLGFFGRVSDTLTSLTFNNTEYDNNVWYILYAKGSEIALYNTETGGCIVKTGTVNRGDGSGNESMGASDHELVGVKTSVISTTIADDPAGFFDGDIDFVAGYSAGQLDFPEAATGSGADIEGVGGNYSISGQLSAESRLIILNESDMSIEWSKTMASGTYEATGLTDESKIVIARSSEGESYGYGTVSGTTNNSVTYLMTVDTSGEWSAEFTDKSNYNSSAYFSDTELSSPASIIKVNSYGSGRQGANAESINSWSTAEKITLEFDWYPAPDSSWYDDDLSDATNYIMFVGPGDWSYSTATWGYNNPYGNNYFRVNLRSRSEQVTHQVIYNASTVSSTTVGILDADQTWRPVKIVVDWPNNHVEVWVDDTLCIDEDIPAGLVTNIGSTFQLIWHWHSYSRQGIHGYRNIELYTGDKG